jgi:carboxylate-amine ligase
MPAAADLRALFDTPAPMTVGLEEEVMVLDAQTLNLAPRGTELLAAAGGAGAVFKLEMPAAQLEVASPPSATVGEAVAALADGRRALAGAALATGTRVAALAAHPFAGAEGPLNASPRYAAIEEVYASAARRQLLSSLHVHVCVRGADRALAVYNTLRGHLPDIAALAAGAPYHEGRDTGLASIRPLVAALLPRQGVPPALGSWEAFAAGLEWAGDPASWWWELRPHRLHGTLELRVPDVQPALAGAAAIAAFSHALVAWLADRHDAGEVLPVPETWRIAENRWSAVRHGTRGTMRDLDTGAESATAERLAALLDVLGPVAERVCCAEGLAGARALLDAGGPATVLREAAGGDVRAATAWVARCFLDGVPG